MRSPARRRCLAGMRILGDPRGAGLGGISPPGCLRQTSLSGHPSGRSLCRLLEQMKLA